MSDDNKPEPFANGRYGNGQFAPGNRFAAGHGNPHAEKVAAWRKTLTETIEPRHIEAAVKVLLRNALEGKGWALRELFDRCFGRPPQAGDLQFFGPQVNRFEQRITTGDNVPLIHVADQRSNLCVFPKGRVPGPGLLP